MPELAVANGPSVDVGALAGFIHNEAARQAARGIAFSINALREDDAPLNEKQVAELIEAAIVFFDGFERTVAAELVRNLTRQGVAVWGLPDALADLVSDPTRPVR